MFFKILSYSKMNNGREISSIEDECKNISGLCANVCYSDGYSPNTLENNMFSDASIHKNKGRFQKVIETYHHSIADHAFVSVYLGNISKMLAMALNSLEFYATSERSGRFTKMSAEREEEQLLYDKWMIILKDRIKETYPNIEDKRVEKLAQENARYFLSVLNKTTSMVHTTSYRQWSYISQWLQDFYDYIQNTELSSKFYKLLAEEMKVLSDLIRKNICSNEIVEFKNRKLDFFARQTGNPIINSPDSYGYSYITHHKCSFACLAQEQRHRTLKYYMDFDGNSREFYVPYILDDNLAKEWLHDMKIASKWFPNGTLVNVVESGRVDDFILKCKERLCGRAQLEVAKVTESTLNLMFMYSNSNILDDMFVKGERVKAKCDLIGTCKEPCEFGPKNCLNRVI